MTPTKKFSGLGRGLGALIPQPQKQPAAPAAAVSASGEGTALAETAEIVRRESGVAFHIPVSAVVANPEQPRLHFRHQELEDLMNSIREHGILQPLTVSRVPGGYELIAGERRFRAAKMLGLETVPVTVRAADTRDKLVLALIENIQREDLNPLEEARAYGRLLSEFGLTQEVVAKQVGKARSTVANVIRLLELPSEVQEAIAAGIVPSGSARAMLALPDAESQMAFFRKLVAGRMTSREAEAGVRRAGGRSRKDPAVLADEERLRNALGTRVEVRKRNGKGSIIVSFYSDEEYRAALRKMLEQ